MDRLFTEDRILLLYVAVLVVLFAIISCSSGPKYEVCSKGESIIDGVLTKWTYYCKHKHGG